MSQDNENNQNTSHDKTIFSLLSDISKYIKEKTPVVTQNIIQKSKKITIKQTILAISISVLIYGIFKIYKAEMNYLSHVEQYESCIEWHTSGDLNLDEIKAKYRAYEEGDGSSLGLALMIRYEGCATEVRLFEEGKLDYLPDFLSRFRTKKNKSDFTNIFKD